MPPNIADCTGGTIQASTGAGIVLNNAPNVSLTRMYILNSGTDGINALTVNGFTLNRSYITDSSGAAGHQGIEMGDFSTGTPVNGTINITDSTIGPTPHDNFAVGIASGTSVWNITGTVFDDSQLNSGFNFEIRNATVTSFLMDGCVLRNQFADGMQMQPASAVTGTITSATIQNSTFLSNNIGLDLNHDGTSNVTYKVLTNTFRSQVANSINFFTSATAGTGGTMNGRFFNNRIGDAAIFNSGGGIGIRINVNGGADTNVLVDANVIRQVPNGRGIEIISRNGTGGTDATVTNNNVDTNFTATVENGGFSLSNIFLQSNCLSVCNTLRSNITGNTVPAVAPTGELVAGQLVVIQTGASTNQLVDIAPASANALAELQSHNTGSMATSGTVTLIAGPINTPPLLFASGGVEKSTIKPAAGSSAPAVAPAASSVSTSSERSNATSRSVSAGQDAQSIVLKQADLDAVVTTAIARWSASGLNDDQIAALHRLKFEVADLPSLYLGEADGHRIRVDNNAGGNGWFIDGSSQGESVFMKETSATRRYTDPASDAAGRIDLLTTILHEMGHALGLNDSYLEQDRDSLMYGFLTKGERRLPQAGQARGAIPGTARHAQYLGSPLDIGTLPVGKSVTVIFKVTVDNPTSVTSVSNQGTVSSTRRVSPTC